MQKCTTATSNNILIQCIVLNEVTSSPILKVWVKMLHLPLSAFKSSAQLYSGERVGEDLSFPVVERAWPDRGKGPPRKAVYSLSLLFLCNWSHSTSMGGILQRRAAVGGRSASTHIGTATVNPALLVGERKPTAWDNTLGGFLTVTYKTHNV